MNGLTILGATATLVTSVGSLVALANEQAPWWVSLIVSIASPFIYLLLEIGLKALINKLNKKGDLTDEQKKALDDKVEDLTDDGNINGSNKKGK